MTGQYKFDQVFISVLVCLIQIDKLPTGVSFPSELSVITVEEATWSAKLQRQTDSASHLIQEAANRTNQPLWPGIKRLSVPGKKGPPVQLTEFMDRVKAPLGCDKVICWVCCIVLQLLTFDANREKRNVM